MPAARFRVIIRKPGTTGTEGIHSGFFANDKVPTPDRCSPA
jgi:hypothetical protein